MYGESGDYEYTVSAATNMTGNIKSFSGMHRITVEVLDQPGSPVQIIDG